MEKADGSGVEDGGGALGEATGHEEASAGCCGDLRGGNEELGVALCIGHPGLDCQSWFPKRCLGIAYWRSDIRAGQRMRRERFRGRCTVCPKPPHRDLCPESNSILRDGVLVVLAAYFRKCGSVVVRNVL